MQPAKKLTKNERRRAAAEARSAAGRRRAERRTLGYALGGVAVVAVVVLGVLAFIRDDPGVGAGVHPSRAGEVSISGPALGEPLAAGEPVPEFSAPAIGGGTVRWSDSAGSPVVLSVWAPWCPHCQAELPRLDTVMKEYPGVRWVTIVTSIGTHPGPDPAAFLTDNGIVAPTAIDDRNGTLELGLGVQGFPTLYFVGSDGTVVRELAREADEDELRAIVESLT